MISENMDTTIKELTATINTMLDKKAILYATQELLLDELYNHHFIDEIREINKHLYGLKSALNGILDYVGQPKVDLPDEDSYSKYSLWSFHLSLSDKAAADTKQED